MILLGLDAGDVRARRPAFRLVTYRDARPSSSCKVGLQPGHRTTLPCTDGHNIRSRTEYALRVIALNMISGPNPLLHAMVHSGR